MHIHTFRLSDIDPLPLLDSEFDKVDAVDATHSFFEQAPAASAHPCDDRGWEDQLDDGEEMSL